MNQAKFSADASMNLLVSCSLATCLRPNSAQLHFAPITLCPSRSFACLLHRSSSSVAHLISPHDRLQAPLISGGQCAEGSGDLKAEGARLNEKVLGCSKQAYGARLSDNFQGCQDQAVDWHSISPEKVQWIVMPVLAVVYLMGDLILALFHQA